jgi:hypothetical protein
MRARYLIASCCTAGCLAASAAAMFAHDDDDDRGSGFTFTPLPASAPCVPGGVGTFPNEQPFLLPPGFSQVVIARQGDGGTTDNWDMHTLNETGRQAGRFLYRTHEVVENGQVSVTDLTTNTTTVLAQRADWNRLDGIVWTPWRTLLIDEEMRPERLPSTPDPGNPQALAGLVYEVDPDTGTSIARPALGAKAHEGIRFDSRGNVYGISETAPTTVVPSGPRPGGYIFKFTPDRKGDLSSGQLYALKIVRDAGDRTGDAVWLPLDRAAVRIDADAAATMAGATGYGRPEDVETATSTGNDRNPGENLYVAITDESRVLKIELGGRRGGRGHDDDDDEEEDDDGDRRGGRNSNRAFVSDYVRQGVNAGADFTNPDNLALDKAGNLFITEDTLTPPGMDVWMAPPNRRNPNTAGTIRRFASLTDCSAEPSGVYFDLTGRALYVHTLHRGPVGDPSVLAQDLSVRITQDRRGRRD